MKIFKNIMSRKPEPEETIAKIDLDLELEPLRRKGNATADDSGRPNASRADAKKDQLFADPARPNYSRKEEPEEVEGAGWGAGAWDDTDWDDDEDWGEEELDDFDEAPKADGGRRAIARSRLEDMPGNSEDRLLEEANSKMVDRESSRRRSAMAHLKAAAAATKADRGLSHVASRDPSGDPAEQSPYRDDLAKVVRPRTTSRPITRPASRQRPAATDVAPAASDDLPQDPTERFADDSERFSTEVSAFAGAEDPLYDDEERAAHIPDNLSEDDFADDTAYGGVRAEEFGAAEEKGGDMQDDSLNAFEDFDDDDDFDDFDDFDDEMEADAAGADSPGATKADDEDGPVPSTAVAEAIAMANEPDMPEELEDDTVRRQIWDAASDDAGETPKTDGGEQTFNVATAVTGRAGRSAGRVKTRLLGFQTPEDAEPDVFEAVKTASTSTETRFPVGWIIVIEGPGRGTCFTMFDGVSQIGRGEDQAVRLDFGDTSISRNNHAAVAYDEEQSKFYLGHGGKSNLVRLNGRPVLSTEELSHGDSIRIGETTLRFVAFCGEDFSWQKADGEDADNGENA